MFMLYRSCRGDNRRKVAMVGTTIATMILTEVRTVANLCCQAFLRTRFLPFNVRYNIYKREINFPGCRLAIKATSGFSTKQGSSLRTPGAIHSQGIWAAVRRISFTGGNRNHSDTGGIHRSNHIIGVCEIGSL